MSAAEARQVLRTLLRAVNRNITSATGNRTWRDFVIAEFRRGGALGSSDEQRAALQEARDYAVLIESVHGYKVGANCTAQGGGCSAGAWRAPAPPLVAAAACCLPAPTPPACCPPTTMRAGAAAVL